MNEYLKVIAGIIIVILLAVVMDKQNKEITILLVLFACSLIIGLSVRYLQPVFDFFKRLQIIGDLDKDMLSIVIKATGIGFLGEITGQICSDAGKASLGKTLQVFTSALILWLMLPLMTQLIELIENMLEYL